jgi:hypothetical protein
VIAYHIFYINFCPGSNHEDEKPVNLVCGGGLQVPRTMVGGGGGIIWMNEKLGESPHRFQNSPHLDVRLDSLITGLHSKLFQREGKGGHISGVKRRGRMSQGWTGRWYLRGEKKGEDVSGANRKGQYIFKGGEGEQYISRGEEKRSGTRYNSGAHRKGGRIS